MHHFTFHLWFFPLWINFEYCMILCSCMMFSSCRQDNQFCWAILAIWTFAPYDNLICLLENFIMTLMTQKWKSQLYFWTFILDLDLYWKRWKMCEKKEKVWSEPVLKGRAEKGQKCQKCFFRKSFLVAKALCYRHEE